MVMLRNKEFAGAINKLKESEAEKSNKNFNQRQWTREDGIANLSLEWGQASP
jgi:hypothetical protein